MRVSDNDLERWSKDIVSFINETVYLRTRRGIEKVTLWPPQVETLNRATERLRDGSWRYNIVIFSYPRRQSKTFLASCMLVWSFILGYSFEGLCISNSKDQAQSLCFDSAKNIIESSQILRDIVSDKGIMRHELRNLSMQSRIRVVSSRAITNLGKGLDALSFSELAFADSDDIFTYSAPSILDRGGQCIIDSSVNTRYNIYYKLFQLAQSGEDDRIFLDWKHGGEPGWINPKISKADIERERKRMTPSQYTRFWLNEFCETEDRLFSDEQIEGCLIDHKCFMSTETGEITQAVDRASIFRAGAGDRTIVTECNRIMIDDQWHYYISQVEVFGSTAEGILDAINGFRTPKKLAMEIYQTGDLSAFLIDHGYEVEVVNPTQTHKNLAYSKLYSIVNSGRLHFSNISSPLLADEMRNFLYDDSKELAKFGSRRVRDDAMDSLAWSIFVTNEQQNFPIYIISNPKYDNDDFDSWDRDDRTKYIVL